MTVTVDGLKRRVQALRTQMNKHIAPRAWIFILGEDEEIPASVQAKFGAHDTVYIRHYPAAYFGTGKQGDYSIGYVTWPGGTLIIKPDGRLERMQKNTIGKRKQSHG